MVISPSAEVPALTIGNATAIISPSAKVPAFAVGNATTIVSLSADVPTSVVATAFVDSVSVVFKDLVDFLPFFEASMERIGAREELKLML